MFPYWCVLVERHFILTRISYRLYFFSAENFPNVFKRPTSKGSYHMRKFEDPADLFRTEADQLTE